MSLVAQAALEPHGISVAGVMQTAEPAGRGGAPARTGLLLGVAAASPGR
jgi:hypothetical protein